MFIVRGDDGKINAIYASGATKQDDNGKAVKLTEEITDEEFQEEVIRENVVEGLLE